MWFYSQLMSNDLLLKQIKSGDKQAIEVFVDENQQRVFTICYAYLQNIQDAEDVTQEVFIKAFEKIGQYKGDAKLSTWLIRIAINLSLNYLRDNKKRLQQVDLTSLQLMSDNNHPLMKKEIKLAVRNAIYNLPEKQREVFILSFYLQLSYTEIAETTSYSISSIESLLFRARQNLRANLQNFYNDLTI
jgi:RNA polymerase sigma-70 factor (ECF subfamily)